MIYWELFLSMAKVGLFSIGGGYVAIPLIQRQIVEANGWLTAKEFTDMIALAEMTPGPIAINAATFVGIRVAGIPGALAATFGCVLPSAVIVLALARAYQKYRQLPAMRDILSGLRPAVVALIASAGWSVARSGVVSAENCLASVLLFGAAFFALRKWRPHPLFVLSGAGIVGIVVHALRG